MPVIMMRLWVVTTIGWIAYNLYLYRDKLNSFKDRNWRLAFELCSELYSP